MVAQVADDTMSQTRTSGARRLDSPTIGGGVAFSQQRAIIPFGPFSVLLSRFANDILVESGTNSNVWRRVMLKRGQWGCSQPS
jgi:hypothetical protein